MTVFVRAVLLAAAAIGPVCVGTCQLYWHHPSHWLSIVSTACIIHHISWLFGYSDALTAHVARTKRPEEAKPPEWMSNNNCNNNQQETEVSESKANTYTSLSRAQKKKKRNRWPINSLVRHPTRPKTPAQTAIHLLIFPPPSLPALFKNIINHQR